MSYLKRSGCIIALFFLGSLSLHAALVSPLVSSTQIVELQQFLVSRGYLHATPNGIYGPLTTQAVKAFQKDNGIGQTGFIGEITAAKINSISTGSSVSTSPSSTSGALTKTLYQGVQGSDVLALQQFLADKGYFTAIPNGSYGPITVQAVIKFQQANGILPTGSVGPITLAKINDLKQAVTQVIVSSNLPINGLCGLANGISYNSAPAANLCNAGVASLISGSGPWSWVCSGIRGGISAGCSSSKVVTGTSTPGPTPGPIGGGGGGGSGGGYTPTAQCGSSNGLQFDVAPTTNLCSIGSASAVTGAGPWSWTCNLPSSNSVASCSASVTPLKPIQYSLSTSVTGSGTITSSPEGINCGSTCTASFNGGTVVTLTATPGNGYTFTSWSGACTGSGACVVTLTQSFSVSATFTALPVTNGSCGSSNGQSFSSAPTTNLCSVGSASAVTGSGPWSWSCAGSNGGTTAMCSASKSVTSTTTLIYDQRIISIPNQGTYPAKGAVTIDPVTNFSVTRVADKSELTGNYNGSVNPQSAIVYSRYTPVNTTGEFAIVHGVDSTSAWLYRTSDNTNLGPIRFKPSLGQASRVLGEVNELRWDYSGTHPYRIYFVGNSLQSSQAVGSEKPAMSFYYIEFNPSNGVFNSPVVIHDFSAEFPTFATNGSIMNDVEGDSSIDSRYWAWQIMDTTRGAGYLPYGVFTYDKTNNQVIAAIQRSCTGALVPCVAINTPATPSPYISRPNMVEFSPLGTRVIVDWGRVYTGNRDADLGLISDGPKGFLPNFTDPIRVAADETHSGWAWALNGDELFVSQNNRNDYIEAVDITNSTTAKCTLISDNSYTCGTKIAPYTLLDGGSWTLGMHFSKFYDRNMRGYAFISTEDSGYTTWGKNQNLAIAINDYTTTPSTIARLGSTYNKHYDYRSEGSGALDFTGSSIWTTANWGFTDGRGDAFRVKLPTNWFQSLPVPGVPTPINGSCGSSNGQSFSSAPTTNLCSVGSASAVTGSGPWSWSCAGSNGGTTAMCSANKTSVTQYSLSTSVTGSGTITSSPAGINCGSTCTASFNAATVVNLTATPANGYTFTSWSGACSGSGSCSVVMNQASSVTAIFTSSPAPTNGVCGSSNGQSFSSAPTTNLCSIGSASAVTGSGPWSWSCAGSNGGTTAMCSASVGASSQATRVSAVVTANAYGSYLTTRSTPSFTTTAGNLVVVSVIWDNSEGATGVSISDTAGNTYTAGPAVMPVGRSAEVQQFYTLNTNANANNVVTATYVGKAGGYLDVSAVQYSATGHTWAVDGSTVTEATDFVIAPVSTPAFSTSASGVIVSAVSGFYDTVLPISTGLDSLVHQDGTSGWVLERITSGAVSNTTVTTGSAAQSGYGRYGISATPFKIQ